MVKCGKMLVKCGKMFVKCGKMFVKCGAFSKETKASYWRTGNLPWRNFENLQEEQ